MQAHSTGWGEGGGGDPCLSERYYPRLTNPSLRVCRRVIVRENSNCRKVYLDQFINLYATSIYGWPQRT